MSVTNESMEISYLVVVDVRVQDFPKECALTTGPTTIVITWFAQNATSGNTTDGNSTEMLAPSEEGGWG